MKSKKAQKPAAAQVVVITLPAPAPAAKPAKTPAPKAAPAPAKAPPAKAVPAARNEKKVSGFLDVDMTVPKTVARKSALNVPSDAPLPQLKKSRNARLGRTKI